jgi:putative ABC transport system permease protein
MSREWRIVRHAAGSLSANRRRTALMALGLAVGVGVLSTVMIVAEGERRAVMELVGKHGLDLIMVRAGGDVQVFAPRADRGIESLFEEDARSIAAELPNVSMVSPVQNQRGLHAVFEDRSTTTRVFGVAPDWIEIRRWGVADGEFISEPDIQGMTRVAVLGVQVARQLFPEGGAIGNVIRLGGDPYTVKGVFVEMGASAGGDDWDDRIVVPFTTSARRLFGRPYLEQIVMRVADPRRLGETAERVRELLRVRHQIGQGEPDDFFVREPEDVAGAALETSNTLRSLLIAVSAVALLAGGLVIMNLMLLGVSQRVREIGVRRAVGARAADIRLQFLSESVMVALTGGLIGVAAGLLVSLALEALGLAAGHVTWVPFALALAACVAIGLAAGVHPARRAAAVHPARAMARGSTS